MLRAVIHYVLCQCRAETAHVSKQVARGRIHVYTHAVYAALHRLVEGVLQFALIYIVLVLSDAYAFRVNLHQLCQRVHQSAANANSSAHGDILIWELLAGRL